MEMNTTNTPRGLVGVPCKQWMWTLSFECFMRLMLPTGSHVEVVGGSRSVHDKRDILAELCLAHPNWRWLLFLDADQTFPADVIQRLWKTSEEEHAGIVAAPSTTRDKYSVEKLGKVNAWRLPDDYEPEDPECIADDPNSREVAETVAAAEIDGASQPIEVDLVGTGVTLIRREVLKDVGGPPWFPPSRIEEPGRAEDVNFVYQARRAGHRVVVDPGVRVGHVGPCAFSVADAMRG